ncbi:MAG TPA: response regulator transcription factor [Actinomycetota bacterium]
MKTTVLMLDDHTLVRQSLVKTVAAEPEFEVVAETGDGDEAVKLADRLSPDVAVLDVSLGGASGLDIATRLKAKQPSIRLIFLSMHDDDATIHRALRIGADGYVVKTASTDELLLALRSVAAGGSYLSPHVARRVMEFASGPTSGRLTDRELEIIGLMATGGRISDVATTLFVSTKTVKNHLTSIYSKLGVSSGGQAIAEAYRRGLVPTPIGGSS